MLGRGEKFGLFRVPKRHFLIRFLTTGPKKILGFRGGAPSNFMLG